MTPISPAEPEWDDLKREFNAACMQSAQSARVQIAHELNQLFRRLRQYETEADWVRLLLEGASNYARQAALFSVEGSVLRLRGASNLELAPGFTCELKSVAAFHAVAHSKEPVTALRTPGEVGEPLSRPGRLAYLFPITNGPRVAAILFAAGEDPEVDQLELVCNMGASALERQSNTVIHAQIAPPPQPVTAVRRLPVWAALPAEQQSVHAQASQYARVVVAEMQLLKPIACRRAREQGDLYVSLAKEMDRAREVYRQRFMILPSMTDYLHKEVVAAILEGDSKKLGADYPGELA